MPVINIISSFNCSVYLNVQFWRYTILRNFAITLYSSYDLPFLLLVYLTTRSITMTTAAIITTATATVTDSGIININAFIPEKKKDKNLLNTKTHENKC